MTRCRLMHAFTRFRYQEEPLLFSKRFQSCLQSVALITSLFVHGGSKYALPNFWKAN